MALTRITEGVIKPNENYVVNNINSSGVTTSTNFKTGTSNLHNVGIEIAGINVLGADTPIGTGATIYDAGGAVFTGVVTATSFSGSGNISADGNVSGVDATFTGNVSIGGTLTYEDVTNIDAVGLITARNGINVSGGNAIVAGMLDVDGHTELDNVNIVGVTTFGGAIDLNSNLDVDDNLVVQGSSTLGNSSNDKLIVTAGVSTFTGNIDLNGDLDVDGHTNLDNVSIAGVVTATTFKGNGDFVELDVDGHTNLDNVSVAGVSTFASTVDIDGNATFGANGSITAGANFALSSNKLRVTGSDTVGIECQRSSNATIQCTETTNSTDLQLRANSDGGLVRTATNKPLILGTNQQARLRIKSTGQVTIGAIAATDSASGILHTKVSSTTSPVVFENDTENADVVIRTTGTNKHSMLGFGDGADNFIGNIDYDHQNNAMVFDTNGGERLNISSGGVVTQVETGTGNGQGGIKASTASAGGNAGFGFITNGTQRFSVVTIGSAGSEALRVYDVNNSAERLRIDSSGRVLIGDDTNSSQSSHKLQVFDAGASGSLALSRFSASSYSSYIDFYKSRHATLGSKTVVNSNDNLGAIRFYGVDGSNSAYYQAAEISSQCDGASGAANDMPGRLTFWTRDDGTSSNLTERLRITSRGRVNIGEDNLNQTATSLNVTRNAGGTVAGESIIAATMGHDTTMINALLTVRNAGNRGSRGHANGSKLVSFEFNDYNALTIAKDGNVGINDATPAFRLDVDGTGRFTDDLTINTGKKIKTSSSQGNLTIQPGPSYPGGSIKLSGGQSGATDRGQIVFYAGETTSLQERLRLTAGGDMRLGLDSVTTRTDSAHYAFNITGKSGNGAGAIYFNDTADNCDAMIAADNGVLLISADYSDNTGDSAIKLRVDGSSEKMQITNDKGVLINHTSKTDLSDVHGLKVANVFRHQARAGASQNDRGFYSMQTGSSSYTNGYFHMKTDIATNSSAMFLITVRGYAYGSGKVIFCQTCGYCYASSNSIINTQDKSWDGTTSVSTYKSSDGYVVIRFTPGGWSSYYTGFCVDIQQQNPAKSGLDHKVTASALETASDHYA